MVVLTHKEWQEVRHIQPLFRHVAKIGNPTFLFETLVHPESDDAIELFILLKAEGMESKKIAFEDCFPVKAMPSGAIDFKNFFEESDQSISGALGMAFEALLAPAVELQIEFEKDYGLDKVDKFIFELKIGTFITHAAYPVGELAGFLRRKRAAAKKA